MLGKRLHGKNCRQFEGFPVEGWRKILVNWSLGVELCVFVAWVGEGTFLRWISSSYCYFVTFHNSFDYVTYFYLRTNYWTLTWLEIRFPEIVPFDSYKLIVSIPCAYCQMPWVWTKTQKTKRITLNFSLLKRASFRNHFPFQKITLFLLNPIPWRANGKYVINILSN